MLALEFHQLYTSPKNQRVLHTIPEPCAALCVCFVCVFNGCAREMDKWLSSALHSVLRIDADNA